MDNQQTLNKIQSYMEDAQFSATTKPYKNIYKVISIWIVSILISDVILNVMTNLSISHLWILTDWYFPLHNIIELFLYVGSIVIYFIAFNKINLRYREKDFLRTWSFVPILIVISKLIPLIVIYMNASFLLNFYNILTIHSIVFIIGVFLIYFYRRNKIYLFEIIINIISIILNLLLTTYTYDKIFYGFNFFVELYTFLSFVEQYNMVMFFLLLFMYLDYKHDTKF